MSKSPLALWKRLFMWDYPRGSVAYDLMVGAILAFIFLTPSAVFRDQPQLRKPSGELVMLPGATGETRFWLDESLLKTIPEGRQLEHLSELLSQRTGTARQAVSVEMLKNDEGIVQGYMASTRP